jgi:hypothetical protein
MKWIVFAIVGVLLFAAQDKPAVISAGNINHLNSVQHIDFAKLPTEAGKVENGWFVISGNGEHIALINRQNHVTVLSEAAQVIDSYAVEGGDSIPNTILDAAFNANGDGLTSVHIEGGAYYVVYRSPEAHFMEYFQFRNPDNPLRVWWRDSVYLEVSPFETTQPRYVLQLKPTVLNRIRQNEILDSSEYTSIPSGPESDPDAFLRIGRIDPPLAVTVSKSGQVKRWNLETGKVTASAKVNALPGAGQVNADGRYFAWRDGDSKALHLLDFETGNDRVVAQINGNYIPFLLLASGADVIIGVNMRLTPTVTAWDVVSGRQIELGEYRQCDRQPDMVRLSGDGATLVIGCNTGLDIWRVASGE